MTEKLYLVDSYLCANEATVIACEETQGGYAVALDRTVFYPTSGGQPHDTGQIHGARVTDVFERGERVLHCVSIPLKPGDTVACEIDWARRFDHMQQHSGEHILSFAAKELFGAVNVGFHLSDHRCTIDLDRPLSREQIEAMELLANTLVCKNLPVHLKYVRPEALKTLSLRKRASGIEGTARIVYMPGGDSCTCCGTHVAHTGEIGFIAVTASEAHKGGVRISFACGGRALSYLKRARGILRDAAIAYSCGVDDVPSAAKALSKELSDIKTENKALQARLVHAAARELKEQAELLNGVRLIVRLVDLPASQLRALSSMLCEAGDTLALLLARSGEGAQYALCLSDGVGLSLEALTRHINQALQARGGGRGNLAQGSAPRAPDLDGAARRLAADVRRILLEEKP